MSLISAASSIHAQTLEPRAYANAPVDMNFLLVGYQNSTGALLFDPAVPITDANADIDMGFLAYVRTLDVAGKSAKAGVILPYASLYADGYLNGNYRTRETDGIADPALFFSMNFYGAPAVSLKEFKGYQQDTIIGFTLKLVPPLGVYEPDKLINIGTNRWTFEPGIGISQALGKWTLEASVAADIYTDNNDFDNGKTREQDNIYSTQFHVIYSFPRNIWAAVSMTYYTGGRTTIEGVSNDDLQQNWRTGFTLALPVNRYHSIKLFGSSGVSTRTGTNYDSLGIAWQYRWGGGL
ncbi:MAG: transporter [Gammaproteobacteria bacterium]